MYEDRSDDQRKGVCDMEENKPSVCLQMSGLPIYILSSSENPICSPENMSFNLHLQM